MSAGILLLADEITALLNAAVAASSFTSLTADDLTALTVRRSYPDWDDDFKDLKNLAVDVVPVTSGSSGGDLVELDSETSLATEPAVDVAVRYRFPASDRDQDGRLKNAPVDKLVSFVEEIFRELAGERMQALDIAGLSANWIDTTVRTYCDYKRLREGSFLGLVRLRYNISRAG